VISEIFGDQFVKTNDGNGEVYPILPKPGQIQITKPQTLCEVERQCSEIMKLHENTINSLSSLSNEKNKSKT